MFDCYDGLVVGCECVLLCCNHWGEPHDGCSCNHRQHGRGEESSKCFRFIRNRTILLGFIWWYFKIVLVLRRRYLSPMRCNNDKRKMCPSRWLHHFDFQHWRWLHALMTMVALFRAGNFWHTHSRSPADKYANRLYDCCQAWYVYRISGAYAHLDCITSTVGDIGNRHSCRSLILIKNVYFIYFLPNPKLIYGWSDTTNLNCRWVQNIVNFNEW